MVYSALVADNFFTKRLSRELLLVLSESHEYQFKHFLTVYIEQYHQEHYRDHPSFT